LKTLKYTASLIMKATIPDSDLSNRMQPTQTNSFILLTKKLPYRDSEFILHDN